MLTAAVRSNTAPSWRRSRMQQQPPSCHELPTAAVTLSPHSLTSNKRNHVRRHSLDRHKEVTLSHEEIRDTAYYSSTTWHQ